MNASMVVLVIAVVIAASIGVYFIVTMPQPEEPPINATFMLHDSEGPNASGALAEELGVNTIPIYLDHAWPSVEPVDDGWNWSDEFPSNIDEYSHSMLRISILHVLAWTPTDIPTWVNKDDLDGSFKEEYGEFVRGAVEYVVNNDISIDVYLVELEANYAGIKLGRTNTWIIDWIKWEVNIIKSVDPDAKVVIPLTPSDLRPGQVPPNPSDDEKLLATEFVTRMIQEGVDFDVIGFNIASGIYDKVDDWTTLQEYLSAWNSFDKEIFVWALGYPADDDNLSFDYPREGGYSEEWQEEQYMNSLRLLLENPKVIGVSIDLYDFHEPGRAAPYRWGLVGGDPTRPETLYKRPSFDAVKEYWYKNWR